MNVKKILAIVLSACMVLSAMSAVTFAETDGTSYVTVSGIREFEGKQFATANDAYDEISAFLNENGGLGQDGLSEERFQEVFSNNGAITWTIYGSQTFDETGRPYFISFGRKAAHYGTATENSSLHITEIKLVGGNGGRTDTITFAGDMAYPYEWWSDTCPHTSVKAENLTLSSTGAQNRISFYQNYQYKFDLTVTNCNVNAYLYYYCNNAGRIVVTDNTFTGPKGATYAFMAQGSATAPLDITFSNNIVSGYTRGINIDQVTAVAEITENTITPGRGYSAVQVSGCTSATIANNTIYDNGNVLTLHENLAKNSVEGRTITVKNNIIKAIENVQGYLIYDDIAAAVADYNDNRYFTLVWTDNTIDSGIIADQGIKLIIKKAVSTYVKSVLDQSIPKEESSIVFDESEVVSNETTGGIRFKFAATVADADSVNTFGAYILPVSLFDDSVDAQPARSVNVQYNEALTGSQTFSADIIDIPAEQFGTDIYAIPYFVINNAVKTFAPAQANVNQ